MGAKFWFFTDPAKLAAQTSAQAFGPAGALTAENKDRFQIADLHTVTGAAPVYAVCRGLICFQPVRNAAGSLASLNLILQPLVQPPFDFPYVEYFIYRGLNPLSVLTDAHDGLELAREGVAPDRNDLVGYIREKVLKHAAPHTASAPLSLAHLGLDRLPDTTTHGGTFGDAGPLDHLFRYPGGKELPLVEAGWKLGEFLPGCGFEVVVQHYGAQPKLSWVRREDAWIDADPRPAATLAADYESRLQREAIGCFVDPCAFWGMFYRGGLRFVGTSAPAKADQLLARLFAAAPGVFKNRARVYLNVRNEVGLSYDFYETYLDAGQDLRIGPDAQNNLLPTRYGVGGWPLHHLDTLTGPDLWFRLGAQGNLQPLLFLHQAGQAGTAPQPFREVKDSDDPLWTVPVEFQRPGKTVHPPWWFVAHFLRGQNGTNLPAAAQGAFDTSPLQFGPIGDRVIAAYRELWPETSSATSDPRRTFVSDKILRYDGTAKTDPIDPFRSLSYDRIGETFYVLDRQPGGGGGVVAVQRRRHVRRSDYAGTWKQPDAETRRQSSLPFGAMSGGAFARPISVPLPNAPGPNPPLGVLSFEDLRSDTALKTEVFDYTYLCLSQIAFSSAVATAAPVSPPPASSEKHPILLSLNPLAAFTGGSAYEMRWSGWGGQAATAADTGVHLYSADGVFFSSPDYDPVGLAGFGSYEPTYEERNLAPVWDDWIDKDTWGPIRADRMGNLVSAFVGALAAASAGTAVNAAIEAAVTEYASKIWLRAVQIVQQAGIEEWADRILYCARAKMEVALKSHPDVRVDAEFETQMIELFESLSRNFAGLDFAQGSTRTPIVVTGFDPYGKGALISNPSGQLALYFAAHPDQSYSGAGTFNRSIVLRTCVFPNRWRDFDDGLVEKVIDSAVVTGRKPEIICTCSLDPNIKGWICFGSNNRNYPTDIHARVDRWAGCTIRQGEDNNGQLLNPDILASLPQHTDRKIYYETRLKRQAGQVPISDSLSILESLPIRLAYNESYHFIRNYATAARTLVSNLLVNFGAIRYKGVIYTKLNLSSVGHDIVSKTRQPLSPSPNNVQSFRDICLEAPGGSYLSNEIYYRVSNLLQSSYTTNLVLQARYSGVLNGHIHVPNLGDYYEVDNSLNRTTTPMLGRALLSDLATSVLAILDGAMGP